MAPQSTLNLASHVTTTCSHVIGQVLVPHGRVFDAGEFPGAHREIVRALPAGALMCFYWVNSAGLVDMGVHKRNFYV